jgi:hypothetical protein
MIEFSGPLYNLLQQFTKHYLQLDTLSFWPHYTNPLIQLDWTISWVELCFILRPTVSRPVCLGIKHPSGAYDQICIIVWQLRICWFGAPSLRGKRVWPLPAQSFSDPSSLGLATIFYCLRFETSLFVASYDSQGHGVGIRPRLHTGLPSCSDLVSLIYSTFGWSRRHLAQGFRFRYNGS